MKTGLTIRSIWWKTYDSFQLLLLDIGHIAPSKAHTHSTVQRHLQVSPSCFIFPLTHNVPKKKRKQFELANSIDLDEVVHNEPLHLFPQCLPSLLWAFHMIQIGKKNFLFKFCRCKFCQPSFGPLGLKYMLWPFRIKTRTFRIKTCAVFLYGNQLCSFSAANIVVFYLQINKI